MQIKISFKMSWNLVIAIAFHTTGKWTTAKRRSKTVVLTFKMSTFLLRRIFSALFKVRNLLMWSRGSLFLSLSPQRAYLSECSVFQRFSNRGTFERFLTFCRNLDANSRILIEPRLKNNALLQYFLNCDLTVKLSKTKI